MHGLVELYPEIVVGYSQLVTITSDSFLEVTELRQSVGAGWPFLFDHERVVQTDLDIEEYTDRHDRPAIPHTFVLEPGLVIHKIYNGYWYWGRPQPNELAADMRDVSSRIRPDWRIDTPEMRAKWDAGEFGEFWPYGKGILFAIAKQYGMTVSDAEKLPRPSPDEIMRLMSRRGQGQEPHAEPVMSGSPGGGGGGSK